MSVPIKVSVSATPDVRAYLIAVTKEDPSGLAYEFVKELYHGVDSEVRLVRIGTGGGLAVIKAYQKAQMKPFRLRLAKAEAELLSTLPAHPQICGSNAFWETETELCILMEYFEAGDVFEELQQARKPRSFRKKARPSSDAGDAAAPPHRPFSGVGEQRAARVARSVLLALDFLHGINIVHRDIKLENVFCTKDDYKLGDFGFATTFGEDSRPTMRLGTLQMMSPEILRAPQQHNKDGLDVHDREGYGPEVDIWALGCMVFELITGMIPFNGGSFVEMRSLTSKPVVLPPGLSEEAAGFLTAALERNSKLRATARELLAHPWLQVIVDSADITGPPRHKHSQRPRASIEFADYKKAGRNSSNIAGLSRAGLAALPEKSTSLRAMGTLGEARSSAGMVQVSSHGALARQGSSPGRGRASSGNSNGLGTMNDGAASSALVLSTLNGGGANARAQRFAGRIVPSSTTGSSVSGISTRGPGKGPLPQLGRPSGRLNPSVPTAVASGDSMTGPSHRPRPIPTEGSGSDQGTMVHSRSATHVRHTQAASEDRGAAAGLAAASKNQLAAGRAATVSGEISVASQGQGKALTKSKLGTSSLEPQRAPLVNTGAAPGAAGAGAGPSAGGRQQLHTVDSEGLDDISPRPGAVGVGQSDAHPLGLDEEPMSSATATHAHLKPQRSPKMLSAFKNMFGQFASTLMTTTRLSRMGGSKIEPDRNEDGTTGPYQKTGTSAPGTRPSAPVSLPVASGGRTSSPAPSVPSGPATSSSPTPPFPGASAISRTPLPPVNQRTTFRASKTASGAGSAGSPVPLQSSSAPALNVRKAPGPGRSGINFLRGLRRDRGIMEAKINPGPGPVALAVGAAGPAETNANAKGSSSGVRSLGILSAGKGAGPAGAGPGGGSAAVSVA